MNKKTNLVSRHFESSLSCRLPRSMYVYFFRTGKSELLRTIYPYIIPVQTDKTTGRNQRLPKKLDNEVQTRRTETCPGMAGKNSGQIHLSLFCTGCLSPRLKIYTVALPLSLVIQTPLFSSSAL